mgnify:CR=1 FL=1|tara:strand:- start:400 stop:753 length:354 start_codon:yes stop_codon:yes gene_type:complete
MNLTDRPIYQKGAKKPAKKASGKDPAYLAALHLMPCCICQAFGETQLSPTQAHHTIHGRHSTRKTPDRAAIPLCESHHLGMRDTSKIALHDAPNLWRWQYGLDTDYIARTLDLFSEM